MCNNITHIQNQQEGQLEKHEDIEKGLLTYFKKVHQEPQVNQQPTIEKII